MSDAAINSGVGPVVELRSVTRSFEQGGVRIDVLRGVDLKVMPGEIVALLGPSGSGKSTMLQAVGLLEGGFGGTIVIAGQAAEKSDSKQRTTLRRDHLGFVYQFHHLLPDFNAIENVVLPQLVGGTSREAAEERAKELLIALGLGKRLEHRPSQLSGGEQQRVAIARAVIGRPDMLVADEPTGNVDPEMALKLIRLFEALNRLGTTVVVATHDVHLLRKVPDSLIMRLDKGMLADPTGALRYPPRRVGAGT